MAEEDLGAIRGAILLTSIGEELAARVLQNLQPRYVQRLGSAIAALGTTTPQALHEAVEMLKQEVRGKISLTDSGDDYLRNVLERALGSERAQNILDRILVGADQSGIDALKWMDAPSIAELIKNEHPQIIAVILSHLEYDQAADVLSCSRSASATTRCSASPRWRGFNPMPCASSMRRWPASSRGPIACSRAVWAA